MRLRIPRLEPREPTASDRVWLALTVAVGIAGACQGALPHGSRARAASARGTTSQRAHHPADPPRPPPARRP